MNKQDQLNIIKEDFINCQSILLAVGDETRQSILLVLMGTDFQMGLRVGEITELYSIVSLKTLLEYPSSEDILMASEEQLTNTINELCKSRSLKWANDKAS